MDKTNPLHRPNGLDARGRRAYAIILEYLRAHGLTETGGCRAFYAPKEWQARGEQYGERSKLIVVYDGGDLREAFCLDACEHGYEIYEGMSAALAAAGFYAEECTGWYAAVYEA